MLIHPLGYSIQAIEATEKALYSGVGDKVNEFLA